MGLQCVHVRVALTFGSLGQDGGGEGCTLETVSFFSGKETRSYSFLFVGRLVNLSYFIWII